MELRRNWVGDLLAMGQDFPGGSPKLSDMADALLYVAHARTDLTVLSMPREELEGTAYGKELDRRMMIMVGEHLQIPDEVEKPLSP